MIIQSGSNTYEINRQDFSAAIDRNILPELIWQGGLTGGNNYVNVKVCDRLGQVMAIETFSGNVYVRNTI